MGRPGSELVRDALAESLAARRSTRFTAGLIAAARALASGLETRAEALEIAEDFLVTQDEVLDLAEGRRPGEPWTARASAMAPSLPSGRRG